MARLESCPNCSYLRHIGVDMKKKITAKSGLWFLLIIPIVIYVGWVINYEVNLGRNQPMQETP